MLSMQRTQAFACLRLMLMIKRFMVTPEHDRKVVDRKFQREQIMKLDIMLIDCSTEKSWEVKLASIDYFESSRGNKFT